MFFLEFDENLIDCFTQISMNVHLILANMEVVMTRLVPTFVNVMMDTVE